MASDFGARFKQLLVAIHDAGFKGSSFLTAAEIALAENNKIDATVNDTRGRTDLPPGTQPEYSVGPFQINLLAHGGITPENIARASNIESAAQWAYEISSKGTDFSPWSTYTGGQYKNYEGVVKGTAEAYGLTSESKSAWDKFRSTVLSLGPGQLASTITGGAQSAADIVTKPFSSINDFLNWFAESKHWWELLFIVGGAILIVVGIMVYVSPAIEQAVEKGAKVAATAEA